MSGAGEHKSILEQTLAAATKDQAMVTSAGEPTRRLIEGVKIRPLPTHVDDRGSITELFDTRWNWHPAPLVFAYTFSIRPGYVKGWNLHRHHEDRYCILQGDLKIVLYDPRPKSSTYGEVCTLFVSGGRRCIVNVPIDIWHADQNIGSIDVVAVNFPTAPYNHENPDKYRLPLDTDLIPYRFEGVRGW